MRKQIFASLVIFIVFLLTGGCMPAASTPAALPTDPPGPITSLQYIGHSCTLITAPDGTRVISDPYGDHPEGLAPFPDGLTADVVTVSHFHPDHDDDASVKGEPEVILKPGATRVGMVKITGYKGDHGLPDIPNTVFVFEIGEVKIVHLGAAGVVTQNDILAAMENADVIITDIMGDEAHPLKDELNQIWEHKGRTIIPTHYSFEGNPSYYGSVTLHEFLQVVPGNLAVVRQGSTLQVRANMPKQIVILAPAANENQ